MKHAPRYIANLIPLLLLLTASCKKDHHTPAATPVDSPTVYVYGTWVDTAVYWQNGAVNNLPGAVVTGNYSSSGIAVSGKNVYTVGYEVQNISGAQPAYWLNGVAASLSDSSGQAYPNCVFVSGDDIYVGGITTYPDTSHVPYTTPTAPYPHAGNVATLWKNGTDITLPGVGFGGLVDSGKYSNEFFSDYVSGIYVSGSNVYVAGGSNLTLYHARYWLNGGPVDLTSGLTYSNSSGDYACPTTTGIFVAGSDVYVAGFETTTVGTDAAIYWKDGAPTFLTDSLSGSMANSIFVSGSDVYIAGWQNIGNYSRAILWKNGTPTTLTGGDTASVATSVSVTGNDVYVSGYQWVSGGHYIATYWHNGVAVKLNDGTSNAIAWSITVESVQ